MMCGPGTKPSITPTRLGLEKINSAAKQLAMVAINVITNASM